MAAQENGPRAIPREGNSMTSDADWVEDVKRWYRSGVQSSLPAEVSSNDAEAVEIGYEAAHPALQARHWPELTSFTDLR